MKRRIINYLISILFIIFLWLFLAKIIRAPLILPEPKEVFIQICRLLITSNFWKSFAFTFLRVVSAFLISVVTGTFIGFLCASSSFCKDFFEIPLALIRSTPVVAIILVAFFWFKSGTVPTFVGILMALPIIATAVLKGLSQSDSNLIFMAKVYNLTKVQIFKNIKLPNAIPFFLNGCENAFGLCWKVIVAGEVLSLPKNALGSMMSNSQVHLETANVLAITILLVLFSFIFQKMMKIFVEKINAFC